MATQQIPKIDAEHRDRLGTRYTRRLRDTGKLPGVIYGHKKDPVHICFDHKQLVSLLQQRTHLLEVVSNGKSESCLVKDVQWDHLGSIPIHIDLARVSLSETVTVEVALELVGEAVGLKTPGALLDHPLSTLTVECKASDIPDLIRVEVSALEVGQSVAVKDIEFPSGVRCVLDPGTVLATISVQAELPEETEATEAGEGEPQVIGKPEEEGTAEAKPEK